MTKFVYLLIMKARKRLNLGVELFGDSGRINCMWMNVYLKCINCWEGQPSHFISFTCYCCPSLRETRRAIMISSSPALPFPLTAAQSPPREPPSTHVSLNFSVPVPYAVWAHVLQACQANKHQSLLT